MAFQVVSLLTALLVTSAWGQFPLLGGFPGMNPFMSGFNKQQNQPQVDPHMLTCINADNQDPQSQIRLTLRPLNRGFGGLHPGMGMGLGPLGPGSSMNDDRVQDWTVDGIMLPSQLVQKAGSYKVAVFSGGRTYGQCKMSALGHVMDTSRANPLMNAMRMGPFSPLRMPGLHPFGGGMFGGQFQRRPNGVVSNNALVSTGTTMYSGIIQGMSYNQLVGRSLGVCQSLQGKQCYGLIPYCCPITRDALPASEVYVEPTLGVGAGAQGSLGFNQVGLVGGGAQVGIPGSNLPLTNRGAAAVAVGIGGDDGLF